MKIPALLAFAVSALSVCLADPSATPVTPSAAAAATAEAPAPSHDYQGPLWNELDVASTLNTAKSITLEAFPNCDTVVVDDKMMRVYHDNGIAEAQDETYTKILTEKGRRKNGSLQLNFQLPYNTVKVIKLERIKPNGEITPIDVAANSKESIDQSQMEENIFDPNTRILDVNIPNLEIGDIVHSVVRTNTDRAFIPGEYAEDEILESTGYIRHSSLEVHAPAAKPLKQIRLRNEVPGTVTATTHTENDGKGIVYHWEINKVPRMYEEPAMPPASVVLQRLSISTTPDWGVISKWAWNLDLPHLNASDDDLNHTVAQLIAGKTTDLEKIKALFYYVSKTIRYMGITPEKDLPGYEPHDVKLTFAKKYGVCRDKAALLVAMLRKAGLPAYPVLVSYGEKKDQDVPNPFFNHEIASVDLGNANYLLMDPTDENTQDLLPSLEGNQSYLVCRPEGEILKTTPVNDPEESMMRVKTTGMLSVSGGVEARSELFFNGVNDNLYRGAFAQMKADDRWRFFESRLKRAVPGAVLKSLKILPENLQDTSTGLQVTLEFSAADIVAFGDSKALVTLPWISKDIGIVNFTFGGASLEKRKYPLQTYVACGLHEDISLQVPKEYTGALSLPTSTPQNDAFFSYNRSANFNDGRITASRELTLKAVEFSPAQYSTLKNTLTAMQEDDRKAPLMKTTIAAAPTPSAGAVGQLPTPATDSRYLKMDREFTVQDAHSAVLDVKFTKLVLTYSGKKRDAEFKLPYNGSVEDVKVLHASVTDKAGKKTEISPEEMNRMDQGWNSSAKRYTGGKILVLSLPGVDIGSIIDVEYQITLHDAPSIARFESFQFQDACDESTLRVSIPKDLPFLQDVRGSKSLLTANTREENGRKIFEWSAKNIGPLPDEPSTPPDWNYQTGVEFFVGSPKDYWREIQTAFAEKAAQATDASAMGKQLASSARTKAEAITAIRNYVDRKVRFAGPTFTDLALRELTPADVSLKEGYGHAADHAILLSAMLKGAGFTPRFVFASRLPDISALSATLKALPLPEDFEDPLVEVDADGTRYYLNDTDQYAHLGATPHDNAIAVVSENGAYETVHASNDAPSKTDTTFRLALDKDGHAKIEIVSHYYGVTWGDKKKFFAELPPEERKQYFEKLVTSVAQGAHAIAPLQTDFDSYPGTETFAVELNHYAVSDGRYLYFETPARPGLFGIFADQRALPLLIPNRHEEVVRTEVQLPPEFSHLLIAPRTRTNETAATAGQFSITLSGSGDHFTITDTLERSPAIVSSVDYPQLVRAESELENKSSRLLLFEKDDSAVR
jgi:transglutaminase-like putative cysteine protease